MPLLIDPQGNEVFVDAAKVRSAVDAGYTFPEGATIRVREAGGQRLDIPAETYLYNPDQWDLEGEIERRGHVREATREREFSSGANKAQAFFEAAGRGATLGLSDVALDALGSEGLAERRQYNPGVAFAGELGGAILPSVVTGGALLPAGQLTKQAAGLGAKLARGSRAAEGAIAGGIEGVGYAAGQLVSESTLSDNPLTTDQVVSHLTTGGALGIGVGGAFGYRRGRLEARAKDKLRATEPLLDPTSPEALHVEAQLNKFRHDDELFRIYAEEYEGALSRQRFRAKPEGKAGFEHEGVWYDLTTDEGLQAARNLQASRKLGSDIGGGRPAGTDAGTVDLGQKVKSAPKETPRSDTMILNDIVEGRMAGDRLWSFGKWLDDRGPSLALPEGVKARFAWFQRAQQALDDRLGMKVAKPSRQARRIRDAGKDVTVVRTRQIRNKPPFTDAEFKKRVAKAMQENPEEMQYLLADYRTAADELWASMKKHGYHSREHIDSLLSLEKDLDGLNPLSAKRAWGRRFEQAQEGMERLQKGFDDGPLLSKVDEDLPSLTEGIPKKDLRRAQKQAKMVGKHREGFAGREVRVPQDPKQPHIAISNKGRVRPADGVKENIARPFEDVMSDMRVQGLSGRGGTPEELSQAFQGFARARKALRKEIGTGGVKRLEQRLSFEKLVRKEPAEAVRVARLFDDYVNSMKQVDAQLGTQYASKYDDLVERVRAGLPEKSQEALEKLSQMDDVGLASVIGLKPEQVGNHSPIGRELLAVYALGRTGKQVTAKGVTGTLSSRLNRWKQEIGRDVKNAAVRRVLWGSVGQPLMHSWSLINKVGDAALKVENAVARFATKPIVRRAAVWSATNYLRNKTFGAPTNERDVVKARMKEIEETLANPERTRAMIDEGLAPLRAANLQLGFRAADKIMQRLEFIHQKAPARPPQMPTLPSYWKPTAAQINTWARYVRAAEEPLTVLEDMENGTITVEAVETLETLYPDLWADVQQKVLDEVFKLEKPLPYKRRLSLSVMFKLPLEPTTSPEFLHAMQQVHQQQPAPAQQSGGQLDAANIQPQTKGQRLLER